MARLNYEEIAPPEDLAGLVECFWIFGADGLPADGADHVIVPDGAVSLSAVCLPDGSVIEALTGPSVFAHRTRVFNGITYAGIRLRPGVAGSVLHADATAFRDCFGPAPGAAPAALVCLPFHLAGRLSRRARVEGLIEAARKMARAAWPVDGFVAALATAIVDAGGDVALDALYARSGISERQLRRRFRTQCGLSPKEFARLRRVRESCARLLVEAGSGQAGAAAASGYVDESHLGREFRAVFGRSARLLTAYLAQIRHQGVVGTVMAEIS